MDDMANIKISAPTPEDIAEHEEGLLLYRHMLTSAGSLNLLKLSLICGQLLVRYIKAAHNIDTSDAPDDHDFQWAIIILGDLMVDIHEGKLDVMLPEFHVLDAEESTFH